MSDERGVDPVQVSEMTERHERTERGEVTVYHFRIRRADGLSAIDRTVRAEDAANNRKYVGESNRDAARRLAEMSGRRMLLDDARVGDDP